MSVRQCNERVHDVGSSDVSYGTFSQDRKVEVEHAMVEDDVRSIDLVGDCTASRLNDRLVGQSSPYSG